MIGLGLRLAVAGGREALLRLVVIAAAVAVGVGLLLTTLAGVNAVDAMNTRYAWLNTGVGTGVGTAEPATTRADPLWWSVRTDYVQGQTIARVDLAATGPAAPVPPGLARLPRPGEYVASPAMARLLERMPTSQLADRYPGRLVGTIGVPTLPSPDSLVVVVGRLPSELADEPGARQVTSIATTSPSDCADCVVGIGADALTLVLAVVAAALLFPLLVFVATATRLAATRREQRFAAMRLIGATPRQISVLAGVEATLAAVVGTAAGFAVHVALRGPVADIPFTGARFFPGDLSLDPGDVVLVAVGVPAGAALVSVLALRRVQIAPLGVSRRATPRPPRPHRLVPLVLGLTVLALLLVRRPDSTSGQAAGFLGGILLTMTGLVVAGPWLTLVGARSLAGRARRPAGLIAARRLAADPHAGFRSVSGLVLALFVTTVAVGVITTIVAERGGRPDGAGATLFAGVEVDEVGTADPRSAVGAVRTDVAAVPGVESVTVVRANPQDSGAGEAAVLPGLVSCAEIAQEPEHGRCAEGALVAEVWPALAGSLDTDPADLVWPTAPVTTEQLERLPPLSLLVRTDGSTDAIETSRTLLQRAFPAMGRPPASDGDFESDFTRSLAAFRQLADVAIIASLVVGGCSLAVTAASSIVDRKRPFSLLRLTGVPVRVLRRVVALESAVPLLLASLVAVGTGFAAAALFLRAQMGYGLRPPGVSYVLIVLVGVAVSLGIIASTVPLLERVTGPETARSE